MKWLTAFMLFFVRVTFGQNTISVATYGAVGDAIQFVCFTTSNSTLVTTTNTVLTGAAVGDSIEIMQAGPRTAGNDSTGNNATNSQDLVAKIVNVTSGTNITINTVALRTLTNTFATYGLNNVSAFSNCIAAASTNTTITIPSGSYLLLATNFIGVHGTYFTALNLTNGGVTFNGAGTNSTILYGNMAWSLQSGATTRGWIFTITTPIANDYPIVFQNLTMDGGVQAGYISAQGIIANTVDGLGWDITHDAIVGLGASGNTFTHQTFSNCVFRHWRGEMLKSTDSSTNGNMVISGCVFTDGNATALNYYPSMNVTNCTFQNLFQIAEYYQAYYTNASYFQNNFCTNIHGNGFAINGGRGNNPPLTIQNNVFYSLGGNMIETVPADNVFILANQFLPDPAKALLAIGVAFGASGYQGTFDNSNIVVAANTFSNYDSVFSIQGGSSGTDPQRVESVQIYSNSWTGSGNPSWLATLGWTTNVTFQNNTCSVAGGFCTISTGANGAQYIPTPLNNSYWVGIRDVVGQTQTLSYGNGANVQVWYSAPANSAYALSDADSNQIPSGAQMLLYNNNSSAATLPIYMSASQPGVCNYLHSGEQRVFDWNGTSWVPAVPQARVRAQ